MSLGVKFEPWLTSPASAPQFIDTFTHTNPTFNPAQAIFTTTTFTTPLAGNWTVTIRTPALVQIRQFTGTGSTATVTWDGTDASGAAVADGTYAYLLESVASGGEAAAPASGQVVIDRNRPLALANVILDNAYFSPNGDTVKDRATLSAAANYTVSWSVAVKDGAGATARTISGSGTAITAAWDGTNDIGVIQPDALYSMNLSATAGSATVSEVRSVTLDLTAPQGSISEPASSSVVSNVYRSGATAIPVIGTATDVNFQNWTLEYGAGSAPPSYTQFGSGTTPVSGANFANWLTDALVNGTYQLRLTVNDLAGNRTTTLHGLTLGHFRVTSNTYQIRRATAETATLTSIIPFDLIETLVIKNSSGVVVRTLVSVASRAAGTHADSWDGRGPAGEYYPDGPYFYVATVTTPDNAYTYTHDLTSSFANDFFEERYPTLPSAFDAFNNQALVLSFTVSQPSRLTIQFSPLPRNMPNNCDPPQICFITGRYVTAGPKTYSWAGTDTAGLYRPDTRGVGIGTSRATFPKNTLVLDGTAPTLSNVRLMPPMFGPALGNQRIEYDLASFQSQAVAVAVRYFHHETQSTQRTLDFADQIPGPKVHTFDGKTEDGNWLPPGKYTVTIQVTDPLGNTESAQMLTLIDY